MFHRLVWMIEEQVTAELVSFGAHSSRVKYKFAGTEFDEIVMNEDFIPYDELGIEYEVYNDHEEDDA
jgi:hypothetical protein